MTDDRLRPLWNSVDLDETERNLEAALGRETTDAGRAEVLTQLARVRLRQGRRDDAESLLVEAAALAGDDPAACARVRLERGRLLRRIHGDADALPVLEQAYESALAAGQHFMAADAAHSCALAGDMEQWTARGLDLADRFPAARYWRGTLLMNLGDWQFERGDLERSRASFAAALAAREQETRNPFLTEYARFGLARALRSLGRPEEAVPLLEVAVEWVEEHQFDDAETRLFRQELTAAHAELARSLGER